MTGILPSSPSASGPAPAPAPVAEPPFAVFADSDDDVFGPFEDDEEEDVRLTQE